MIVNGCSRTALVGAMMLMGLLTARSIAGIQSDSLSHASAFCPSIGAYVVDTSPWNPSANPSAYQNLGSAMSVEVWIYPVFIDSSQLNWTIVTRPRTNRLLDSSDAYSMSLQLVSGVAHPVLSISGNPKLPAVSVVGSDTILRCRWYHLAGTYDGATLKLYVNGSMVAQTYAALSITSAGRGFNVAMYPSAYYGLIKELRLWNVARTETEIQSTMWRRLSGLESGLAGYWPFDRDTISYGQHFYQDDSPNENDLSPSSSGPLKLVPCGPTDTLGTPAIAVNPTSLDFGSVEGASSSSPISLRISNPGTYPLFGRVFTPWKSVRGPGADFFVPADSSVDLAVSVAPLFPGLTIDTMQIINTAGATLLVPFSVTSVHFPRRWDGNNIAMWVQNNGTIAHDPIIDNAGLEWPKGSHNTAVYQAGLWVVATVQGTTRTATSTYNTEFQPGSIVGGVGANPSDPRYRLYYLNPGDGPGTPDYDEWPMDLGAPANPDGTPKVIGSQTCFCVYNDLNPALHAGNGMNGRFGTMPLGAEVQQTVFGFTAPSELANSVFLRFKIVNKSSDPWINAYVALWADPDLGWPSDDLAGIDTTKTLAFVYNGTDSDGVYGSAPPAVGFQILKGGFLARDIQAFSIYTNGGLDNDPRTATQVANYMRGIRGTGVPFVDPTTGQPTTFPYNGDPVTGSGWVDSNPGDRRVLLSTGPFNLEPGQSKEIVGAIIMAQGTDRLSSITALRAAADTIRSRFVNGEVFGGAVEHLTTTPVLQNDTTHINDVSHSGATLDVVGGTGGATVAVATYVAAPPGASEVVTPAITGVGKYIEVETQGSIQWPVPIRIYYTQSDLEKAGVDESRLDGIYYWNGLSNSWISYANSGGDDQGRGTSTTGVDTNDVTVDGIHYAGYVYANAYHLTTFAMAARRPPFVATHYRSKRILLGDVRLGDSKDVPIAITNAGNDTLRITSVVSTRGTFVTRWSSQMIVPGATVDDTIRFTPIQSGQDSTRIFVTSNAPNSPDTLVVSANATLTGVSKDADIPRVFSLANSYPNPFNPSTTIHYTLPHRSYVTLSVFNTLGQKVAELVNSEKEAGSYDVKFDGSRLASGVYLYRIQAGTFVETKKLVLLR